ncbi:uncharacterized protein N7483_005170 [Penicillium malachiteum]|uniref:uncharacterized protein n=1 Tax=Penicillium malachiteum TaxID=1324776 RepID=UPI002547850D|nr:uncharacterized protein N7483_005170 [Penicillium malachiteum]KAJ5730662.1 hypothetical protein N7483_005170 [Penicillium malachiteum]
MGFRAVEDRPTPREVYNWRLYFETLVIATGSLLFGYDSAFIGTTIARDSFLTDFNITASNSSAISSNITSVFQAGAFFGALFCFFITERLGRKWTLQISVFVFIIGAVMMVAATHQLGLIYAGRVLTGLECGAITASVPSYLAELSIPSIRDRNLEAYKVLEYIRNLPVEDPYIQEDIYLIRNRLNEEAGVASKYGTGSWAFFRGVLDDFSRKGMRNRVFLVFCAFTLQNFSGAAAINYYSPTLFESIGIEDTTLYTGIYGLVKAVSSLIFYLAFVDKIGRRRPVIVSSFACACCLWYVGAYVKIENPAAILDAGGSLSSSNFRGGQAATGMVMIYAIFWSFGLNGVPWIVSAEIFPGALRNFTGTWAALVQWATQFAISKGLPYMFDSWGYGTWFFFAGFLIMATIWSYCFLPETKGLTIDQMDMIFGYNQPGTRGIPHTRLSRSEAIASTLTEKTAHAETEHHETV